MATDNQKQLSPGQAQVTLERQHLFAATGVFKAVLDAPQGQVPAIRPFYVATVHYFFFNMNRLCLQDQRLSDLIRQRGDAGDKELTTLLDDLAPRLDGHRALNATLLAALGTLQAAGDAGLPAFVKAARNYLEERRINQGDRHHTLTRWRDALIHPEDWDYISARTPGETAAEKVLYDLHLRVVPPDVVVPVQKRPSDVRPA